MESQTQSENINQNMAAFSGNAQLLDANNFKNNDQENQNNNTMDYSNIKVDLQEEDAAQNSDATELNLNEKLAIWVMESGIEYYKVDKLLEILSDHLPHGNLPLSGQELVEKNLPTALQKETRSYGQSNETLAEHPTDSGQTEVKENVEGDTDSMKGGEIYAKLETTMFPPQQSSLNQYNVNLNDVGAPTTYYKLPLSNLNELINLEILIRADKDERHRLIRFLSSVGGDSVRSCTFRVLYRLVCKNLASQMSWTGKSKTGEKSKFSSFPIVFQSIFWAVRLNPRFRTTCEYEVEMAVKGWLQQAGNRTRRVGVQM